ncbi:heat shock protein 30-like [Sceloporus undulatus]|uniref:heat shock protein 30-like n=1 Tax=Sceloporus undulatus TaxID=8520 RepID=UPI001C4C2EE2|nr:heat shock protein 30-like [Sceloporus undulatus]
MFMASCAIFGSDNLSSYFWMRVKVYPIYKVPAGAEIGSCWIVGSRFRFGQLSKQKVTNPRHPFVKAQIFHPGAELDKKASGFESGTTTQSVAKEDHRKAFPRKMLCRLHLAAPRSPLRSRILWPRAGSLFNEVEREMDALWDFLTSNWRPTTASSSTITTTFRSNTGCGSDTAANPVGAMFAVTQDMAGFDPQELVVKLIGEKVVLTGKKATQTPDGPFRYEIFRREWDVPETIDRERLSCSISSDGELRIEAPSADPAMRTVPITVNREENSAPAEAESETTDNSRAQG